MDNLGVKITATSDVAAGVGETKAQLGGLEGIAASLNSAFSSLGSRLREAFTGGAGAASKMTEAVKGTDAATKTLSTDLSAMIAKIHEGAESVRTFQMRAKEFAEVYVAMFAVEQVADFINKMGEAAEKVQHLSQQFGMSVAQVQQLQGVATATGIPIEALTRGMGLLDRNMVTAATSAKGPVAQAMRDVGISLNDGRSQMEKFEAVADKFQNMADGPKKAALAMQLFGRSGRELIPVLDMGRAGIEQLNAKMQEYGVVNEDAVAKGVALAESTNETRLGFQGIWNVLTDALAPAFKYIVNGINELIAAFIQSYQEGGIVATIFGVISAAIQVAGAVLEALGEIFAAVWDVISEIVGDIMQAITECFGVSMPKNTAEADRDLNLFKDTLTIVKDAVIIFVDEVGGGFRLLAQIVISFGKIAYDAMHLNWGAIEGDWNEGMSHIAQIVQDTANKVRASAAEMAAAISAASQGKALGGEGGIKLPKATGDSFDFNPTGAGKKAKKPKGMASEMDVWKQQLADMLNEEQNWGVDEQQFSENFWQEKLAKVKKGSKEEVEIRRMIAGEKKAIFKEEQQAEIESIKNSESIRLDDVKTQTALVKSGLNEQLEAINQKEKLGKISATKAVAERNAVNRQLLQADMQEAEEEYQIKLQALQQELALEHLKPDERRKINDQIVLLTQQHNNQMLQLNAQFNAKMKQQNDQLVDAYIAKWKSVATSISAPLANVFDGVLTKQKSFRQAAIQEADSLASHWIQKGFEMLANYIATKLGMRAADTAAATEQAATQSTADATKLVSAQTTNAGAVASDAAVASAGAFAATAAIPIVGPALAPGAAAAAYGAVMGMVPLAFAEGGFDIPWGQNPLTQLHQEEMVLPAHLANPMRDFLSGGFMLRGGGDRGGAAGRAAGEIGRTSIDNSRGDVHLHHEPHYPAPGPQVDMDHLLKTEGDRLLRFFKKAHRDGAFN